MNWLRNIGSSPAKAIIEKVVFDGKPAEKFATELAKNKAREAFDAKLAAHHGAIVENILSHGPEYFEEADVRAIVREALFLYCKALVKNGHIADLWRDVVDDKVVAIVSSASLGGMQSPEARIHDLVRLTRGAFAQVVF